MAIHPLAGKPAPAGILIDVDELERAYYERVPDVNNPHESVSFGTSGHRGSPLDGSLNEAHILAMTQAICDYRLMKKISGPLFLGKDTHAVSGPAQRTALEVLAAHGVEVCIQAGGGHAPTPVISHAILTHNKGRKDHLADGIVITPSHNPPTDGGFKYNPPNGGPADTDITGWIQNRANELMRDQNRAIKRVPYESAIKNPTIKQHDYIAPYVRDLRMVIDMDGLRGAALTIGCDPLGGASLDYWDPI